VHLPLLHPIDVLLTENELAEGFLAALRQRYLAEKFFYWFPLSVKAWLELCRGEQPYKNFSRSYQLVARHAGDIAGRWQGGRLEVVSLGAGQGDKDLLLLQALAACGVSLRYRPVDSSQALLEMAVRGAAEAGLAVRGLKADVAEPRTAQALAASATEPRLYLILGNSLGVLDPVEFLGALRNLLRREDHLLVDGEIFDARETLVGYDNPVNRRFAFAPLASLGLEEGRDGALVFSSEVDSGREGLYRVTKYFRAARRLEIPVAGHRLTLEAEERISMNCSYKYSRPAFLRLVQETGSFELFEEYLSEDERFLLVLAGPAVR
jgi:uncharacterized SAM-dependent methyltransferase